MSFTTDYCRFSGTMAAVIYVITIKKGFPGISSLKVTLEDIERILILVKL